MSMNSDLFGFGIKCESWKQGCIKSHFAAPTGWSKLGPLASQVGNDLWRPKMRCHEDVQASEMYGFCGIDSFNGWEGWG